MSDRSEVDVVTGAFGYTGKYIARRLLNAGRRVRTLTGHPDRPHDFGDRIEIAPLNFRDPAGLESALRGAGVLYNTYWVRFNHGQASFEEAVANSRALIQAARAAACGRSFTSVLRTPPFLRTYRITPVRRKLRKQSSNPACLTRSFGPR